MSLKYLYPLFQLTVVVKSTESRWLKMHEFILSTLFLQLAGLDLQIVIFFCLPSHCITIIYESLLSSSDKLWRYLMAVIIYLQGTVWMTKRIVKQTNEKKKKQWAFLFTVPHSFLSLTLQQHNVKNMTVNQTIQTNSCLIQESILWSHYWIWFCCQRLVCLVLSTS